MFKNRQRGFRMGRMGMSRTWLVFGLGLVLGCVPSNHSTDDPKKVLADYISLSFAVKKSEDRKSLLELMSGDVKERLASWSDEQFQEAFLDSKREFIKLAFREIKSVSATEVQITYELTYMDKGQKNLENNHEAKITNRKLAQIIQDKGKWFISDVKNIKEVLEFKNELSLP